MEEKFTEIYDKKKWGSKDGKGSSGSGSNISPDTKWYIDLLMKYIKKTESISICDVGCGDWEFSKTIDWSGLHYVGIDCVKSVIDDNINKYQKDNIRFFHTDAKCIPSRYDFVILKDVIQHWTDEQIDEILPQIINSNSYVLLVNGYKFGRTPEKNDWTTRVLDKVYHYHPVDVTKKPLCDYDLNIIDIQHRRCKEFILIG